ncbi:MAG: hypothetical protein Q8906_10840 [Bacillota bacterium]|nr:hypothetical protein [Bacillota bacterium]
MSIRKMSIIALMMDKTKRVHAKMSIIPLMMDKTKRVHAKMSIISLLIDKTLRVHAKNVRHPSYDGQITLTSVVLR